MSVDSSQHPLHYFCSMLADGGIADGSLFKGPLPPIPLRPMPPPCSPPGMRAPSSRPPARFLRSEYAGALCMPVTLPCDASAAAAFQAMLWRPINPMDPHTQEFDEAPHSRSAHSVLPAFARRVVGYEQPAAGLCSGAWRFTRPSLWSLKMCSDTSPQQPFRPGFGGELSADCLLALDMAAYNTAMDMTRVFFPAVDAHTPCPRRYFTTPPLGYALVSLGHCGYLVALEWIGKLCVSPLSLPFFLQSQQHAAALAALPDAPYQAPVTLAEAEAQPWLQPTNPYGERGRVCWQPGPSLFRKLVRGDARTAPQFARMATAYAALAGPSFQRSPTPLPPALAGLPGLRLLYGAHELLVEMRALPGRACSDAEALGCAGGGGVLAGLAQALAWLAVRGVLYTDLKGPNVLLQGEQPLLVDFDDCLVVQRGSVRSLPAYKAALAAFAREERLSDDTFAVSCSEGLLPEFEQAMEGAFELLEKAEGSAAGGAGGAGAAPAGSGGGGGGMSDNKAEGASK